MFPSSATMKTVTTSVYITTVTSQTPTHSRFLILFPSYATLYRCTTTAVQRTVLNNKRVTITANSIISSISSSTIISSYWPLSNQKVQPYYLVTTLHISKINWVACYGAFTSLCAYVNRCAYELESSLIYSCSLKIWSAQMLKFGLKFHSCWRQFFKKGRCVQHRWTLNVTAAGDSERFINIC